MRALERSDQVRDIFWLELIVHVALNYAVCRVEKNRAESSEKPPASNETHSESCRRRIHLNW